MPVIFPSTPRPPTAIPPNPRRRQHDDAVKKLAGVIAEVRNEGHKGVEAIMDALNARGIAAPNGKLFTFGTTHRILWRLFELNLGPRPRTVSEALSARPYKQRESRQSARMAMARASARIKGERPELLEGLHEASSKPR